MSSAALAVPERAREPAACLYDGHVMHARHRPVRHRFRYRVFSLLIDLDRLDEAGKLSAVFCVNRPGLVSFHEITDAATAQPWLRRLASSPAQRG